MFKLLLSSPLSLLTGSHIIRAPMSLTSLGMAHFAKYSKPMKQPKKKEKKVSVSLSDEKAAKLSKAEEEMENERKKREAERLKAERERKKKYPIVTQAKALEKKISQTDLDELQFSQIKLLEGVGAALRKKSLVEAERKPEVKGKYQERVESVLSQSQKISANVQEIFPTPNDFEKVEQTRLRKKVKKEFFNTENIINSRFRGNIKRIPEPKPFSKRSGVLAYKVGMTGTWDRWGTRIPLTVLQVDRCQVIQVKTVNSDGYTALQLGIGEKNLKRLKKPEIGHLLKNDLPPKDELQEFRVDPENLLPVGYQFSARHFTPGQYVDVTGITVGKGFQGVMKRWNFAGQPASHGCSISHRMPGSTGQRQDPGRVFKGKKMAGRMGGDRRTIQNLKVYKIDVPRSLIFLVGPVPGKNGTLIRIKDAHKMFEKNLGYLNYPTFVPEAGKEYADELIMDHPEQDPEEVFIHENDVLE